MSHSDIALFSERHNCGGCATCGGVRGCSRLAIDQQSYNGDKGFSFGRELFREFAFIAGGAQHGHALTNEREQNIGLRAERARGKIKTASEVY